MPCRSECNHRLPKARIPTIYSIYYQAQIPHILLCLSLLPQSTSFSHAYIIRQDEQNSHSDRPGDGQLPSLFHVLSMVRQIRYDADSTSRSDVHGVSLFHQPILYNTLQESQYLPSPLSLRAVITILVIHSVPVLTNPPFSKYFQPDATALANATDKTIIEVPVHEIHIPRRKSLSVIGRMNDRLSGGVGPNEEFRLLRMPKSEYTRYWARDERGNYVGTEPEGAGHERLRAQGW